MESLRIHWKCNQCGHEREERPDWNEGGTCSCGGQYKHDGESWDNEEATRLRRGY